jgi:hypothetical protein
MESSQGNANEVPDGFFTMKRIRLDLLHGINDKQKIIKIDSHTLYL